MHGHKRRRHLLVSLLLVLLIAPHLWVIAAGEEQYPLTCAAMFAYPVHDNTPRYGMRLTATFADDTPARMLSFGEARANARHFFAHTYGSASPASHHDHFSRDTPDAFAQRLSAWFASYITTWTRLHPNQPPPRMLTLWLDPVHPHDTPPRAIATFDTTTAQTTLHPTTPWPIDEVGQP